MNVGGRERHDGDGDGITDGGGDGITGTGCDKEDGGAKVKALYKACLVLKELELKEAFAQLIHTLRHLLVDGRREVA